MVARVEVGTVGSRTKKIMKESRTNKRKVVLFDYFVYAVHCFWSFLMSTTKRGYTVPPTSVPENVHKSESNGPLDLCLLDLAIQMALRVTGMLLPSLVRAKLLLTFEFFFEPSLESANNTRNGKAGEAFSTQPNHRRRRRSMVLSIKELVVLNNRLRTSALVVRCLPPPKRGH